MRLSALNPALLLLLEPAAADDLDGAYQRLKVAQTSNDAASVKKAAAELHTIATPILTRPAPPGESESDEWTSHVADARSADLFSEYALYATAIQSEPATMVDLISSFETQNPKSQYLDALTVRA